MNPDLLPSEHVRIEGECARSEQSNGDAYNNHIEQGKISAEVLFVRKLAAESQS